MKKVCFMATNKEAEEIISSECEMELVRDDYRKDMFYLCVPDEADEYDTQAEIECMLSVWGLYVGKDFKFV